MFRIRKAQDRGFADLGWLNSAHTFSFANYHHPDENGFSDLLVINEDRVTPAMGFGMHSHQDMEIFSYVLSGELAHKDSMGTGAIIQAGDVQIMSAGTGIDHSEFNHSDHHAVHFLQIWIVPCQKNLTPRYQQKHISHADKLNQWRLILSPDAQDQSLQIQQDCFVYANVLDGTQDMSFTVQDNRYAYVHVITGSLKINGKTVHAGDGVKIVQAQNLDFSDAEHAEILLFDLRAHDMAYR